MSDVHTCVSPFAPVFLAMKGEGREHFTDASRPMVMLHTQLGWPGMTQTSFHWAVGRSWVSKLDSRILALAVGSYSATAVIIARPRESYSRISQCHDRVNRLDDPLY